MKVKTSITLSPEAIQAIDEIAGAGTSRSRLNRETEDVLRYQAEP